MPCLIIDLIPLALSFPLWEMGTRLPDSMFVVKFHWSDIKYSVLLLCLAHSRHSASSMSLEWDHLRSLKKITKWILWYFPCLDTKWKTESSPHPMGVVSLSTFWFFLIKKRAFWMQWERQAHMAESHRTQDTLYYMECFCTTDVHTDVVINRDN